MQDLEASKKFDPRKTLLNTSFSHKGEKSLNTPDIPPEKEREQRLLTAAPELLAALKLAIPYLKDHVARTNRDFREKWGEYWTGNASIDDRLALDQAER